MNYRELAENIIENIGGKENVNQVVHCATRLRFRLKDEAKARLLSSSLFLWFLLWFQV